VVFFTIGYAHWSRTFRVIKENHVNPLKISFSYVMNLWDPIDGNIFRDKMVMYTVFESLFDFTWLNEFFGIYSV